MVPFINDNLETVPYLHLQYLWEAQLTKFTAGSICPKATFSTIGQLLAKSGQFFFENNPV